MTSLSAPLVGSRFYPPAMELIQGLGFDEPLRLLREPENPYDENAISVWLPNGWEENNAVLFFEVFEENPEKIPPGDPTELQLGHIAATHAKLWAPVFDQQVSPFPAKLSFSSSGRPEVTIEVPEDCELVPKEEEADEQN